VAPHIDPLSERVDELEAELARLEQQSHEGDRQRREFEAIFQYSPTATVIVTEDGTVTAWNEGAERLFGYLAREAVGRNIDDLVTAPEQRSEAEGYNTAATAGLVHAVTRRVRKDGQFVEVELRALPVVVDGRRVGSVAIYHDITALESARRAAEEQRQQLETILRHAPAAMITLERDGFTVASWNPAAEQLFGYTAAEARGRNIDDLVSNAELRAEAEEINRRVAQEGPVNVVTRRARRDGRLVDVEIQAVPVIVGQTSTGVVAIYHDVTELLEARRAADAARQQAEAARGLAEAANEAKGRFLSTVSHELRTPLTSVLGFAKMIRERLDQVIVPAVDTSDPKRARAVRQVRDNVGIIVAEGERLTAMINNVLDLAKIESGFFEWRDDEIAVPELLERAGHTTASLFEAKGLELRTEIADGLPTLRGDRDRLLQVVINLLSNAVKFTDEGWVEMRARCQFDELVVAVADTGTGLAPEDHATVFEQFRQVGDTQTDKPRGTGLGLPISKEIVEHHGGRMWVESEPGKGSTFYFTLPVSRAGAATASPPPRSAA
jgi:PAS domain S-box-containing protein